MDPDGREIHVSDTIIRDEFIFLYNNSDSFREIAQVLLASYSSASDYRGIKLLVTINHSHIVKNEHAENPIGVTRAYEAKTTDMIMTYFLDSNKKFELHLLESEIPVHLIEIDIDVDTLLNSTIDSALAQTIAHEIFHASDMAKLTVSEYAIDIGTSRDSWEKRANEFVLKVLSEAYNIAAEE